jgi:hypothetical protein
MNVASITFLDLFDLNAAHNSHFEATNCFVPFLVVLLSKSFLTGCANRVWYPTNSPRVF